MLAQGQRGDMGADVQLYTAATRFRHCSSWLHVRWSMADVRSDEPGVWIRRTAVVAIKILTDNFV